MNDPLSIQIHNRGRFEQGEPGEWLKLPATAEQLQAAMRRVGITAENQQDFFINGLESPVEAVNRLRLEQVQAAGVDAMNYLASRLEPLEPAQVEKLNVNGDMLGFWDDVHQLTEYIQNTEFHLYIPGVTDHAALGDYYLNKSGLIQMPEGWKAAVDVEKLGQLAVQQEKGILWDNGYMLETGDEWQEVTEIPQEYSIMSFPQREFAQDTPERFGRLFAETMTAFYAQHPATSETMEMANTSPAFIEQEIASGFTALYLDKALDLLETDPTYQETAAGFRYRLEALRPQREYYAGERPGYAGEHDRDAGGNPDDPDIERDEPATANPAAVEPPPEVAAAPLPVNVITLESEKPAEKLKEITDKLESGIAGIFESEQYKDYLKTLSKFHDYSLNNTILIAMQKPDASLIAGFNAWKNDHGRNVIKGQKGIKIIAPSPYKVKVQQEKTDPATGKPVIGADGKPVTEETERKIPAYKVVSVFDVSQTEGKEIPTIGADILTGDVEQYKDFFAALEKASPVPVAFENIEGGANGYYHQVDKRIAIDEGMSELQTLKTTIHEIAHARLHDIDRDKEQGEDEPASPNRRTREVEAESIAYTVCQHYGLDTSDYSFGYVAGWSSGKELNELKASLETIRTTAAELITEIDGHFTELQKDREQTTEHEQQAAPEPQPGYEEWSEPATPENAPDNPGEPSDDISAYLPEQGDPEPQPEQAEPTTTAPYYTISEEAARRAKEANSYRDYRPGSATAEYRQMVDKAVEIADRQKSRVDPMHHEKIDRMLNTYARKLAENMNHSYAIDSRVPSMLIAGGAGINAGKKEKQNAARDSNMREWRDIQGLLDKIRSTGMGGISADDPGATNKLQEKLTGLEQLQDTMKTANAYYRKHKTLDGCPVLSAEQIQKLSADMKTRWYGREAAQPFEPYKLQNNNAEINRLKKRVKELAHREEAVLTGWDFEGGKVEVNKQDNRLQVFFDGKPDADTRAELKSNGFKWAPSVGAWQRQLNGNAFYAANYVGSIQPLTGEKPTDMQRRAAREARAAQQPGQQSEQQAAPKQERQQGDTYAIYQLKDDPSTRDFRFEPYDRLQAAGLTVDPSNYAFIYAGQLGKDETLETIYERFNISHPADFTGHSLSVADVVTLNRDGIETAHYVDSFGFKEVPEFLNPAPAFDMQQTADRLQRIHDSVMEADPNKTMGVAAYNVAIKRLNRLNSEIPGDQQQLKAVVEHAAQSTDLSALKQRMGVTMQEVSHIRAAEMSTEQNYNMIDGIPNNSPSVAELEAKAKAGEQVSLYDLAKAIKAERSDADRDTDKKPSIREQLKQASADLTQRDSPAPSRAKENSPGLEV
jgi:antirestriction protein ArdC